MFVFVHPHQDPSNTVLDVLELLGAFARDPDEFSLEETKAWQSFPHLQEKVWKKEVLRRCLM